MKLLTLFLSLFAVTLLPGAALCADRQFAKGEAVSVQPDTAYVLVRTMWTPDGGMRGRAKYMPVLIRVLSPEELEQAAALAAKDPSGWKQQVEPNVVQPLADLAYEEHEDGAILLTSLKPGTYVLGGFAVTNWAMVREGLVVASLCMGTVKFEVKPGVITDLGTFLTVRDDQSTTIPELANVVVGKPMGPGGVAQLSVAIRPAASSEIPESLKTAPFVPAEYHAISPYPNYLGARIARLAPLAGVLDYDKDGNVIDLRAKTATP